ncbi:hypothetical protein GCM10011328_16390 [Hafnia psychrotolerans]|uniref:Uncharacterized protein n=1 Tax=Hafnia psychrotolerans TaxID=1477018 RepID=A0ABQ1GE77_9GAMM|nr:hypothetical protein GCM10011328_16390 [Hafnia psychrotolerans]
MVNNMEVEVVIGLLIFAFLILNLIQCLIRQRCERVRNKRLKERSEFLAKREAVERQARKQL